MGDRSATAGAGAAVAEPRKLSEAEVADGLVVDMKTLGAVTARQAVAEHLAVRELHDTQAENARLRRQLAAARMILRERGEQLPASADDDEAAADDDEAAADADELADVGPAAQRHLRDGAAEMVRAYRELENDWIGGADLIRIDVSVPAPIPSGDSELLTPDGDAVYSRTLIVLRGQAGRVLDRLNATLDRLDPMMTTPPPATGGDEEADADAREEEALAMLHVGGRAVLKYARRRAETHFKGRLPLILTLSTFGGEFSPSEVPCDLIRFDTLSIRPDALARAIHGLQALALELDPEAYNCDDLMLDSAATRRAKEMEADEDEDADKSDGGGAADAVVVEST